MTISTRLDHYLTEHEIPYQTLSHGHSNSSIHSAVAANIPLMHIAKGIILEDHEGRHMMAVLPANAKINVATLNDELRANFHLIKEHDVYPLFKDCEHGAIPPIGDAYHMAMVCDTALTELDEIYLEAGDHRTLLKLDREAFMKVMGHSKFLHFSSQVFH